MDARFPSLSFINFLWSFLSSSGWRGYRDSKDICKFKPLFHRVSLMPTHRPIKSWYARKLVLCIAILNLLQFLGTGDFYEQMYLSLEISWWSIEIWTKNTNTATSKIKSATAICWTADRAWSVGREDVIIVVRDIRVHSYKFTWLVIPCVW